MKNFVQPGDMIDIVAPAGGTISGRPVIIGSLIGVAAATVAAGIEVAIKTTGVFEFDKVSAQAWATQGLKIYWDSAANNCTTTAGGNTLIGVSAVVAANPSAKGQVRLGPTTV